MQHKSSVTWVIVSDQTQANIYAYERIRHYVPLCGATNSHYYQMHNDKNLISVADGKFIAPSMDDYEIGHQVRGTSINSISYEHNTQEPHGNVKDDIRRRFINGIAEWLHRALALKRYDKLVLVAPAKIIGELRKQLTPEVQNHVTAVLPKNLTVFGKDELCTYLQDTLTEACRG